MTNEELITKFAVSAGLYSEEQIADMIGHGEEIPLHTLVGWKARGYKIKKGEKGMPTKLWKMKSRQKEDEEEKTVTVETDESGNFYLTRAYLFRADQVVQISKMEE